MYSHCILSCRYGSHHYVQQERKGLHENLEKNGQRRKMELKETNAKFHASDVKTIAETCSSIVTRFLSKQNSRRNLYHTVTGWPGAALSGRLLGLNQTRRGPLVSPEK
jgi:hypothetical protein